MTCSNGVIFVILLVGAIRNVFGENLRLAKQSPLDRQFAKQIWTHGPYRFDCFPKINVCRGIYHPPVIYKNIIFSSDFPLFLALFRGVKKIVVYI